MLRTIAKRFSGLKFPVANGSPANVNYSAIVEKRKKYLPGIYRLDGENPLLITKGHMQYLEDHSGKKYIDYDAGNSGALLGHSHPEITEIAVKQAEILIHTSSIYMNERQGVLSKMILDSLGPGYDTVYLCNSASEANDFACFIARLHGGDRQLFSLDGAYHGSVGHARSATALGAWSSPNIMDFQFQHLSNGEEAKTKLEASALVKEARNAFKRSAGGSISGLIYEPIQLQNKGHSYPHNYLAELEDAARSYKGITISDESNTGLGRVGSSFWGFKWQRTTPNVVTIAKGLGNGLPFAAVATVKEIASKINFAFFNTFSGGHVQCAVGVEVLNRLKDPKLIQHVETVGDTLAIGLKCLQDKHWQIESVQGKGLCLAINFKDEATSKLVQDRARERGLIFGRSLTSLTLTPPLCLSMQDVSYTVEALEDALLSLKK